MFAFLFGIIFFPCTSGFCRHHQQPNGSLLVGPLTKLDSGWFLCVATREQERDHRYIYLSVTGNAMKFHPLKKKKALFFWLIWSYLDFAGLNF